MTRYPLAVVVALLAQPAAAQQQRVIVVPADAQVVIAARGQVQPRAAMTRPPSQAALARSRASRPPDTQIDDIMALGQSALLPLIAGGIVAALLVPGQGSRGGIAAPAATR